MVDNLPDGWGMKSTSESPHILRFSEAYLNASLVVSTLSSVANETAVWLIGGINRLQVSSTLMID